MIGDWSFLKSRRFWALVIIGIFKALETVGALPSVLVDAFITVLGGFIGIDTIDKFSRTLAKIQ